MPKCCFENFPSLKSSKARLIIPNISFKIQLYRPNKHSYDTLGTTSSLQCKNILKNFVVNEKTAKIQQQEKSRSLSTFAEKHARASPFPHHTSISATSARFTALNRWAICRRWPKIAAHFFLSCHFRVEEQKYRLSENILAVYYQIYLWNSW
jgi:hypothetical protein